MKKDSPHCFVTGCAGFIASHLIDRLLAEGYRVTGVDNLKLGRRENLASAFENPAFRFIESDISVPGAWTVAVAEAHAAHPIDTVWHMAANSDIQAGAENPEVDLRDTFLTTFQVLAVMRELGIGDIVFASSSAIYGRSDGLITERTLCRPASNYGAMKLASEGLLSSSLELFLKSVWIMRFPNVIGPRSTHGVIHDLVKKLRKGQNPLPVLGDGLQEKPYVHVRELIDAMLFIRKNATGNYNCYNISPPDAATVRYIAETVCDVAAPGTPISFGTTEGGWVGDVPKYAYDTSLLTQLGWSSRLGSRDAVRLAVEEIAAEIPPGWS